MPCSCDDEQSIDDDPFPLATLVQVDDVNRMTTIADILSKAAMQLKKLDATMNGSLHMYVLEAMSEHAASASHGPVLEDAPTGNGGVQGLQGVNETCDEDGDFADAFIVCDERQVRLCRNESRKRLHVISDDSNDSLVAAEHSASSFCGATPVAITTPPAAFGTTIATVAVAASS